MKCPGKEGKKTNKQTITNSRGTKQERCKTGEEAHVCVSPTSWPVSGSGEEDEPPSAERGRPEENRRRLLRRVELSCGNAMAVRAGRRERERRLGLGGDVIAETESDAESN